MISQAFSKNLFLNAFLSICQYKLIKKKNYKLEHKFSKRKKMTKSAKQNKSNSITVNNKQLTKP